MSPWHGVIEAFGEPVVTDPDGNWWVSVHCDMRDLANLLRGAPCDFRTLEHDAEELLDRYGQGVDIESQGGLLVSQEGWAIVDWGDHWQAGLSATLTVYSSLEAFRRALSEGEEE